MDTTQKKDLHFARNLAQKTGTMLAAEFRTIEPTVRGLGAEIKTTYDMKADALVCAAIEAAYPNDSYLTEETGWVDKGSQRYWVVDPLDGTGNYVNGNPFFAVSLALWDARGPVLGVIDAPILEECYVAVRDSGASVEECGSQHSHMARVSSVDTLNRSYIVSCEGGSKERSVLLYHQLYHRVKDLRKIGSASIELAWVGLGRAEAYIAPRTNLWDIGAGVLFVKEAGGVLMDFSHTVVDMREFKQDARIDLVATNGKIDISSIRLS